MASITQDLPAGPAAPPVGASAPQRPPATIVPLAGLPVVGLVIVGLVVAIATNNLWGLTFFHIAGGGLWTGIDLFVGLVIGPILGSMSIPARVEFSARFMPKMLLIMPTLVTCTLASGWQLARFLGTIESTSPVHGWVVASFIIVGVMAIIALGLLEPANLAVLFELRKPQPNGELIARLMRVFVYTAGITGIMQVATLVVMTKIGTGG